MMSFSRSSQIKNLSKQFGFHKDLLQQIKNDFDKRSDGRIYSVDFAVLFPYLVPVVLQPNKDDPLYYISNNIFLSLNERIKSTPIDIVISFPTILEILAQFGRQKQYLDKVAGSEEAAGNIMAQLITGDASADILKEELLNVRAHIPANDSYSCLRKFVDHLSAGRLKGYGDYFDIVDFRTFLKREGSHDELRRKVLNSKRYTTSDPLNLAFRVDMDTLHLSMSKYFSERGLLFTGPKSTRNAFGENQAKYARSPEVLLGMLHAMNQSSSEFPADIEKAADSFLTKGIEFYNDSLFVLDGASKTSDLAEHELGRMSSLDKIYRRELYMDRRKRTVQSTAEDMKAIVQDMSSSEVRDAHKMAAERVSDSALELQAMLDLEITEDLKDFLSPEGKDYVDNIFTQLSSK